MGAGASANPFKRTARVALEVKKHSRRFEEVRVGNYVLTEVELGRGAFSVVKLGHYVPPEKKREEASREVAIKCVDVTKLRQRDLDSLADEVRILRQLNHPSIIRVEEIINNGNTFYIVLEKLDGGELFDRIVQKESYSEREARKTTAILLNAVSYMHERQIVHRDLKPENLLLKSMDNDTDIKIADFGFATNTGGLECLRDVCGSPAYVAPEVIMVGRGGPAYGVQCDMWSIGVIIFVLLGGYSPFGDGVQSHIFNRILSGAFHFHEKYWAEISEPAKDLIRRMLVLDPRKRISAAAALDHPWLKLEDENLCTNLEANLEELRKWNVRRKFRRVYQTVVACNKMKKLMGQTTLANLATDVTADNGATGARPHLGAAAGGGQGVL